MDKNDSIPSCEDSPMWDLWMSQYHFASVSVAEELGLFRLWSDSPLSSSELAKQIGVSEKGLGALSSVLRALGFLNFEDNNFSLTPPSLEYLLEESRFFWGGVVHRHRESEVHRRILLALRQDTFQMSHGGASYTDMWKEGAIDKEAARVFTERMHGSISAPATAAASMSIFEGVDKLLDVGGGSGAFAISFTTNWPGSQAAVFDLPEVCAVANGYIENANLSDRVRTIPGNFFKSSWPDGFDAVLLSNILHDWPEEVCIEILSSALEALPVGGKIFIHEMLLGSDQASPLATACFHLLMFINHQSQQFSFESLSRILSEVGFCNVVVHETFGYYSVVVAEK